MAPTLPSWLKITIHAGMGTAARAYPDLVVVTGPSMAHPAAARAWIAVVSIAAWFGMHDIADARASFAAQAAYDVLVPGFVALFEREGRDFARFYDAVRALAARPKEERLVALQGLAGATLATRATVRP